MQHHPSLTIWERHLKVPPPVNLESAATRQDVIFFCLPASLHFALATWLPKYLRRDCLCVSVAKGLDDQGRPVARSLVLRSGRRP